MRRFGALLDTYRALKTHPKDFAEAFDGTNPVVGPKEHDIEPTRRGIFPFGR